MKNKWRDAKWYPYTVAICVGVLLSFFLQNLNLLGVLFANIWSLIRPLTLGVILALLINPLCCYFDEQVYPRFFPKALGPERKNLRWRLSVFAGIFVIILVFVLLLIALIPAVITSVLSFVENFSSNMGALERQLNQLLTAMGQTDLDLENINETISRALNTLTGFLSDMDLVTKSAQFGSGLGNFGMGFILSIYFLLSKEMLVKGFSKFMRRILGEDVYVRAARFANRSGTIITRYISGTLLEGLMVGCVNAIFMVIFRMPYVAVVSIIVGLTNLAPTFGPIVGCVLGMFILLLSKPVFALYFLLFTLVLQTVDGYIIKPKLFGDTLGVSPILILISIIIGGRMFGVVGILFAIPIAAICSYAYTEYVVPGTIKSIADQEQSFHISDLFFWTHDEDGSGTSSGILRSVRKEKASDTEQAESDADEE